MTVATTTNAASTPQLPDPVSGRRPGRRSLAAKLLIAVRHCLPVTADAHSDLRHFTDSVFCLDDRVHGSYKASSSEVSTLNGRQDVSRVDISQSEGAAGQEH